MPNIKSSIKRVETAKTKTLRNTAKKSALKTSIKKCNEAIQTDSSSASSVLNNTVKAIDQAAAKHILHKNTAARKKSKLAKALNAAKSAANN